MQLLWIRELHVARSCGRIVVYLLVCMVRCLLQNLFQHVIIPIFAQSRYGGEEYRVECSDCSKENSSSVRSAILERRNKSAHKMLFQSPMNRPLPWWTMQSKHLWHFSFRRHSRTWNFGLEKCVVFLCSMIAEEDASFLRNKASSDFVSKFLAVVQEILKQEGFAQ